MKKTVKALLLTTILSLTFASAAFAGDVHENPQNDFPHQAVVVSPGTFKSGYVGPSDQDWYKFTPYLSGQQRIFFLPPDNQVYFINIYDAAQVDSGSSASPIASKVVYNGYNQTNEFSFNVQGGKAYYALVYGSTNETTPYHFAVIGQ
ncbi:hypothetical protein [Paenibacillus aquistagni]|uniref:Uncharacterized protein n=1 Tax=Paenibacillus aquistagni TaxID=1852522 RepID=A0A1X7KMM8_9BACL|nr:hypothetical protein [Paenibacillus aquistagni]SMG42774.1 hypothetical protein SAMN06295960_2531 [Paenibacillus aquistagni]